MEFSHHSSNPLEARPSDPINVTYNQTLQEAQGGLRRSTVEFQSSDPMAVWPNDDYKNSVNQAVGTELFPPRRGPFDITPKGGVSPVGAAQMRRIVDLDASDDELALIDVDEETPEAEAQTTFKVEESVTVLEADISLEEEETKHINGEEDEEGDFFDGENFPDEDEDMASIGDVSLLGSMSPLTPCSSNHSSPYSSPQSSRPPSPDELKTLSLRPLQEQHEIEEEIEELYESVPELNGEYKLVDRLGTGTFSSVYKAVDMRYNDWCNAPWQGHHPPESSAHYQSAGPNYKGRGGRSVRPKNAMDEDKEDSDDDPYVDGNVYVAIKRIYTTSGPDRIRNELSILEDCRGCRHTSQIITAFRNNDQVVIVLPYQRNMDFREFYTSLHPEGIKCYFRCLFRALRDIHARGIIHRDVKPANFLYDPFTGIGTLCDFGLASRIEDASRIQQHGKCLHGTATEEFPHGKTVIMDPDDKTNIKQAQKEARAKSNAAADKVGYPEQDRRPTSKANRAGTRGFRAPEVLLKCSAQTGAVDVWSAGVILLFFLTGKFPIFQSNDDVEGLMELALIMGRKNTEKVATLHGRTFASNVPDLGQDGISWAQFVERLNPDIHTPKKYDMRFYPHNSKHRDGRGSKPPAAPTTSSPQSASNQEVLETSEKALKLSDRYANPPTAKRYSRMLDLAFNLLDQILHFESTKRYTPRKALFHAFLDEAGVDSDDAWVPHLPGEGVCGDLHYVDDSTGTHFVRVKKRCTCGKPAVHDLDGDSDEDEERDEDPTGNEGHIIEVDIEVEAGLGIPIGTNPCEYHKTEYIM